MIWNYVRGKLAPNASILADAVAGKDGGGHAFNLTGELYDRFTPIFLHSYMEFYLNNPHDAAAIIPSLSGILGVGLESPESPLSENGRDVWGNEIPQFSPLDLGAARSNYGGDWRVEPVNQDAELVGLYLGLPPKTINGVALTPEQYDDYVRVSGRLAHMRIEELMGQPAYQAENKTQQLKGLEEARTGARHEALYDPTLAPVQAAIEQKKESELAPAL